MRILRVAVAQMSAPLGDIQGNRDRVIQALQRAHREKADVLITPELMLLGFGSGDIYLDKVEQNLQALQEIVRASRDLHPLAVVGFVNRDDKGFHYNAAAVIHRGTVLGLHHKIQLVNYRLFDEKRYFQRGTHVVPMDTPFGRLGVLICEDAWFPEPARILALRGAEALLVISASPYNRGKVELWEDYLRVRALDNLLPMVFVNMAGIQDGVAYWGGSMNLSARGDLLNRAAFLEEDFQVWEVDLDEPRLLRRRDIRLRELRRETLEELLLAYEESQDQAYVIRKRKAGNS